MFPNEGWLEKHLPNLVVNLCSRLRSRKIEERQHARDILCQIATLLGPNYFAYILSILEGSLQRGYQLHILLFTINALVNALVVQEEDDSKNKVNGDNNDDADDEKSPLILTRASSKC